MFGKSIGKISLAATFLCLAWVERAEAQGFGVGIGIYRGQGSTYPYFGGYPLYYRGFYGNGMSMCGPPVPIYGIVPGTFGGSDYRVNQNAPFLGVPLGVSANYVRPRRIINDGTGEPPLLDSRAFGPAIDNNALNVEVRVPLDNVIVFIDGQFMKQNGQLRYFASPPMKQDEALQFTVRAVWTIDGQRSDKTILVGGKAGERVVADFMR